MNPGNLLWWSQFLVMAWLGTAHAGGPLFDSDEVLDVDLRGPLAETLDDGTTRKARAFSLTVGGTEVPVSVRVRGKSRAEVCSFPPLRLDFAPGAAEGTPFAGQGKLKLVTHCKGVPGYDQNVLEEYAAYRMFAMLSEVAYRPRLLRIRYVDTDRPNKTPQVRYGFLIEPAAQLAARVGGEVARVPHVVKSRLDQKQAALVFVFHYMIASTDWSLVTAGSDEHCCHNIDLVRIDDALNVVPYDFDLSGLVAPKYARRNATAGVRAVRSRRYRGYCIDNTFLVDALQSLLDHEAAFQSLLQALPGADAGETQRREEFLARFYRDIRDPAAHAVRLDRQCIDR